nr:BTAD domain-containing putative transcriptional regulator [Kitasatospora xanthocidica]
MRRAPFRESAYRCRMEALAASGNRAEALRCYQQLRQVLAEELGIDPAAETQELYLAMLRSPVPAAPAPAAVRAVDPVLMGIFEPLALTRLARAAPAPVRAA